MQQLSIFLKEKKVSKANSERASIIEMFLEEVNLERKGTKWKPLTARALAIKISHVKTNELMDFYNQCMRYKREKGSFSKCMWGSIKV